MGELATDDESDKAKAAHDPFAVLGPFERFAVRVVAAFHRKPWVWIARVWQIAWVESILWLLFSRRLDIQGLERLDDVARDTPMLVVANHRTWFDLFAVFWVLRRRRRRLRSALSFPVRADFFYENPVGLFLCGFASGFSMYPPIFRKGRARLFNLHSVQLLIEELGKRQTMVGFHPEGTRSKSEDPHELLPAKRGAGELVLAARPVTIPVFVTGLKNSFWGEMKDNFRGTPTRMIRMTIGAPIDLKPWENIGRDPTHAEAQSCSEALLARIAALGEEQRARLAPSSKIDASAALS